MIRRIAAAWRATFAGRHGRVRTPTVLQGDAAEGGPAALAIILGAFGRHVHLETLRQQCGVSRDGSKAEKLVEVGGDYGLEAASYPWTSDQVLAARFPLIVFWGFNHFLVVEGRRRDQVFVNDPATGPRSISRQEFDRAYSGVALTFEPTAEFRRGGEAPKLLPRLAKQVPGYRPQLLFVVLVGVLLAIPGFLIPGLTALFVDDVVVRRHEDWLRPLMVAMAIAVVVQGGLAWLREITLLRLQTVYTLRRSAEFMWHIMRLPTEFFGLRFLGDILSRVGSVEKVARFLTLDLGLAAINALTALLLFLLMTLLDPWLAFLSLGGALLNVVVLQLLQRARMDASKRLQTEQGKLYGVSVVGLRTIETLKATGAEDDFFGKWAGYYARVVNSEQLLARLEMTSGFVPPLIVALTTAAALALGGWRVMEGLLTIGALVAYQMLFATVALPIQRMVAMAQKGQQTAADIARLDEILEHQIDWRHREASGEAAASRRDDSPGLRFEAVTFGYARLEEPLIHELSIEVRPGGWIALVGSSGSGKSTLGKLACGLLQPWSGRVLLDGRPLTSYPRRELASMVASVDQNVVLFAGSVRDNIALWDRTVSHETLRTAARDAQLLDVIESMPGNFDAPVGENGRDLSGGQRQRMEIARALVQEPGLLILDEATAALDPLTEVAIMEALRRRGMTCVVVAHRLSTIRDADEILVLDQGRIVERGRHEELIAAAGEYARLVAEGNAA